MSIKKCVPFFLMAILVMFGLAACGSEPAEPAVVAETPAPENILREQETDVLAAHGAGVVFAEPDVIHLNATVQRSGETANQAIIALTDALNKINSDAEKLGIKERRVLDMSVWPGQPPQPAFTAEARLRLTITTLEQAPGIIESVLISGITRIDSIAYNISDRDMHVTAARAQAFEIAQRNAAIMAAAANVELGELVYIAHYDEDFVPQTAMLKQPSDIVDDLLAPKNLTIKANVFLKYNFTPRVTEDQP